LHPRPHICTAPPRERYKDAGFSLLEILAALVIIALMTAAVVLSLTPPERGQNEFRDQLLLRLNQTAKDAVYTGRVNALSVSEEGLQIMGYQEGAWAVIEDFPDLARTRLRLEIENENIELPKTTSPLILFEPTGEITDFALSLRSADIDFSLFRADDGSIRLGGKT